MDCTIEGVSVAVSAAVSVAVSAAVSVAVSAAVSCSLPTAYLTWLRFVGRYVLTVRRPRMLGFDAVLFGKVMFRGIPVLPEIR